MVKWRNGKIGEYKIGASGKVDVKYIEPGVGFSYYRDHLYVPGKQHETSNITLEFKFTQISVISDFGFTPVSAIFQQCHGGNFNRRRKVELLEKLSVQPEVTNRDYSTK